MIRSGWSGQEVNEMKLKLPQSYKKLWERYKYVLAVVAAGLFLLLLPSGNETGEARTHTDPEIADCFDVEGLERKLETVLSKVEGAGPVSVVLTVKEGSRRIPAQDTEISGQDQSRQTVIISQGSGVEQPVVLQNIYPKFQGALVVCPGGGDATVRLQLMEAVRALTGLSSEKISICRSK